MEGATIGIIYVGKIDHWDYYETTTMMHLGSWSIEPMWWLGVWGSLNQSSQSIFVDILVDIWLIFG